MPRVPQVELADMTAQQREFYDKYATGVRAAPGSTFPLVDGHGQLIGPPAVWVLSQPLGLALERFGYAIRYELTLSRRAQEIAILMVAQDRQSEFERFAHAQAGLKAGLTENDLAALAAGEPPVLDTEEEWAVYEATRRILDTGSLDDDAYQAAADVLTAPRLFELVTLIGYYLMLATQLSVFDIRPPGIAD
ncbi:MAG TPA: carboxymuconolactone decarboxylase family protein [Streptosporangiaceae bacterium]|jgi:alkylhydroperoxidase family enzyme